MTCQTHIADGADSSCTEVPGETVALSTLFDPSKNATPGADTPGGHDIRKDSL